MPVPLFIATGYGDPSIGRRPAPSGNFPKCLLQAGSTSFVRQNGRNIKRVSWLRRISGPNGTPCGQYTIKRLAGQELAGHLPRGSSAWCLPQAVSFCLPNPGCPCGVLGLLSPSMKNLSLHPSYSCVTLTLGETGNRVGLERKSKSLVGRPRETKMIFPHASGHQAVQGTGYN